MNKQKIQEWIKIIIIISKTIRKDTILIKIFETNNNEVFIKIQIIQSTKQSKQIKKKLNDLNIKK